MRMPRICRECCRSFANVVTMSQISRKCRGRCGSVANVAKVSRMPRGLGLGGRGAGEGFRKRLPSSWESGFWGLGVVLFTAMDEGVSVSIATAKGGPKGPLPQRVGGSTGLPLGNESVRKEEEGGGGQEGLYGPFQPHFDPRTADQRCWAGPVLPKWRLFFSGAIRTCATLGQALCTAPPQAEDRGYPPLRMPAPVLTRRTCVSALFGVFFLLKQRCCRPKIGRACALPPPPLLYKPRPCPSYSRRRDRNNCVCNLITYEM